MKRLVETLLIPIIFLAFFAMPGCSPENTVDDSNFSEKTQDSSTKANIDFDTNADAGVAAITDQSSVLFLSWNVESEGADSKVIGNQLSEFSGYDVIALQEVEPSDFDLFQSSFGSSFDSIRSRTGYKDRLQIIFNSDRFELVRRLELDEVNFKNRYRSPLVAHLKDKESSLEFLVMTNHLARGKEEIRQDQAGKLVEWARDQNLPVVSIGDFNFDYVFATASGNKAFNIFLRDEVWKWVKPNEMIDSNWFDPEEDGIDNYEGSLLDFAFVAGPAMKWDLECEIIVRDGDFPDNEKTSDHRPFRLKTVPR